MVVIDPFSRLVQFSFCSLVNGLDDFDFFFCINFESFNLTMGFKLLICCGVNFNFDIIFSYLVYYHNLVILQ